MSRTTIPQLQSRAASKEALVMLTAYDSTFARLAESAGIDFLLVGDSVGMTQLGYESTVPVTFNDILRHAAAVVRSTRKAHVVFDMPFMSYHGGLDQAVLNAGRALQESGAQSIKFEGGRNWTPFVARCTDAGIPVMAHIGLRPQQSAVLGGYPAQGKSAHDAREIVADALAHEEAGAWAILLEKVPAEVAATVTEKVSIPVIGIGAGPHCSGQVQVMHDILGLDEHFRPKHSKQYADLSGPIIEAFRKYAEDVKAGQFPSEPHTVFGGSELEGFMNDSENKE